MIICRVLLTLCVFLSAQSYLNAQSNLQKEDLCPNYDEIDPLEECLTIESYAGLAEVIQESPSGSQINLCPFFLRKVSSVSTILVNSGVRVRCVRKTPDDFCTITGLGNHLVIDSAEDTLWQGLSFRGSNNHAVYIAGKVENSENATHTFCQTSFMKNVRTKDTRGGALMLERSAGIINVVQCFFQDNYSKTFGASIYSRANQLNIIFSLFIKNKSLGYGPAIYSASGGGLMIKTSSFRANNGREGHDIVFNPSTGTEIYQDGLDNFVNDGSCRGVFNSIEGICSVFEKSPPVPAPTIRRPVTSPTNKPTSAPSVSPRSITVRTRPPKIGLTLIKPVEAIISRQDITSSPIGQPSLRPTGVQEPTKKPIIAPIETTTKKPTLPPTTTSPVIFSTPIITSKPTIVPTKPPTMMPTQKTSDITGISLTPTVVQEPTEKPIIAPVETTTRKPTLPPTTTNPVIFPTAIVTSKLTVVPTKPPTMMPTQKTSDITGIQAPGICVFRTIPDKSKCVKVQSFDEFKATVESGRSDVTFCGGFNIRKIESEPVKVATNTEIRCINECSFFGIGPFVEVGGALTDIRFKNMKFANSQDSSAIIVSTLSSASQTTFCDMEFSRNQVSIGNSYLGGAITVDNRSGVVNVVNSTFSGNKASRGGAIHSNGSKLNVVDSKFVANTSYHAGNAIFVGQGNLSVKSSTFILNTNVPTRTETRQERISEVSFAIAVQPDKSTRLSSRAQSHGDGGSNKVILSGICDGIYQIWEEICTEFTTIP